MTKQDLLNNLVALADYLDQNNMEKQATVIDGMIKKVSYHKTLLEDDLDDMSEFEPKSKEIGDPEFPQLDEEKPMHKKPHWLKRLQELGKS